MATAAVAEGGHEWASGCPDSLFTLVILPAFKVLSNLVTLAFSFPVGLVSPLGLQLLTWP